jgi:uncharacterized membrane protein YedE/YeeE
LSFLGGELHFPTTSTIDRRLVIGAVLFGAGWGLAGFCPGPALVSLAGGQTKAAVFVGFMLVGMVFFEYIDRRSQRSRSI